MCLPIGMLLLWVREFTYPKFETLVLPSRRNPHRIGRVDLAPLAFHPPHFPNRHGDGCRSARVGGLVIQKMRPKLRDSNCTTTVTPRALLQPPICVMIIGPATHARQTAGPVESAGRSLAALAQLDRASDYESEG